jgi:H/ACA ribonucleoprotein complex subunit 4
LNFDLNSNNKIIDCLIEGKLDKYGRPNENTPQTWLSSYQDYSIPAPAATEAPTPMATEASAPPVPEVETAPIASPSGTEKKKKKEKKEKKDKKEKVHAVYSDLL